MKKKINPEDLHLNEEVVEHSISPNVESTRNTCRPTNTKECVLPHDCDTTMTDQTYNGCNSIEEDKCDQSLVCQTVKCYHTQGCINTFSAAEVCCPMSGGRDCNSVDLCQDTIPVSDCVCLETEVNCQSDYVTCDVMSIECKPYTDECKETDMCAKPISDDGACEAGPAD